MKLFIFSIMFASLFTGCIDRHEYKGCNDPIYLSYEKFRSDYPAVKGPREMGKAAKIYVYGDTLLINEKGKGVHVVDNRVKETPVKKYFIDIPGNIDMAIKDGYLYVDSFTDLIVLNVKDINNITEVYRKEKVFPYDYQQALNKEDMDKDRCYGYDETRGFIIGYE